MKEMRKANDLNHTAVEIGQCIVKFSTVEMEKNTTKRSRLNAIICKLDSARSLAKERVQAMEDEENE